MNAADTQEAIIEAINASGDCFSQYTFLLEKAAALASMSDEEKSHASLVDGCQSKVWLESRYIDGFMYYRADSDTLIVKGLLALLVEICSGRLPSEVIEVSLRFLKETDLGETLEDTRMNGASAVLRDMKVAAAMHTN